MTYRVTITISHYRLGGLLAQLKDHVVEVAWIGDDESKPTTNGKKNESNSTYISLGTKEPAAGTLADKICGLVMTLEGKHGAGMVTRSMLNEAMKKAKFTPGQLSSGVANAVTSKFLKRSKE